MKTVILITVFLIYGGANWYVAARICRMLDLLGCGNAIPVFATIFSLLSATVLLSFLKSRFGFQRIIYAAGSVWMGVIMYLLLYTLAADIIMLILRLADVSGDSVRKLAEAAVLVLTVITVAAGAIHARNIQTARYSVKSEKAAEPITIVLLSDIHIGALGIESRLQDMADRINAENPDIVCIAGDIFNNDISNVRNPSAVIKALKSIKAKYGVFACLGNHDCGDGFDEMLRIIAESGITLLREDCETIPDLCTICGRAERSPIDDAGSVKRGEFVCTEETGRDGLPVIVLDHNPARIGEYSGDVSLLLCGHTHRGQMFPGSLITDSMYSVDYGLLESSGDRPAIVVTSGIGYWGPPLRVGTDSEIAVIELN